MKKTALLISLFTLAVLLRFWQLGGNPPSLDWDEASLGYNAYSILKTGRDEYGTFLPLSFRSFGDYKPPMYVYLTVLPVWLFGLNEFSTRFISALLGSLSVIVGYYIIRRLFPGLSAWKYLLFFLLFAISPWHIQFSRVAFEANTAVFFFLLGVYGFLVSLKHPRLFFLSAISFALSMYSYHSPRLVVPLFLLGLCILFWKFFLHHWRVTLTVAVIFMFLILPIVIDVSKSTAARFGSVTILNDNELLRESIEKTEADTRGNVIGSILHNRRIVYGRAILGGYIDHFNFDFLFLTGDAAFRHHAAGMGMLYSWEFPFLLVGIYILIAKRKKYPLVKILFLWFIVAPFSSSLTKATPHAVRSLLYIPTHEIFIWAGLFTFIGFLLTLKRNVSFTVFLTLGGVILFHFFYYLHMYWIHSPIEYSQEWQYGYKEMVEEVSHIEKNFPKVIVTYRYDQPYIYFLFYQRVDPAWYQKNWSQSSIGRFTRKFGKYEFRNLDWKIDRNEQNVLFVSSTNDADEIPPDEAGIISEIKFLNGKVAMRLVAR